MYLASSGLACDRSSRTKAAFADGPRAAAISRNLAATSSQTQRCAAGLCPAWTGGGARPHVAWGAGFCENGFGYVSQVPELAVGCGQFGFAFSGELRDDSPQHPAAHLQRGFLPDRKRSARKKYSGDGGLLRRSCLEILGDDRDLLEFFGGRGDSLAGFSQLNHVPLCGRGRPARASPVPAVSVLIASKP